MNPLDANEAKTLTGGASFPIGDRVYRLCWAIAWLLLCRWTPPPMHLWRRFVLSLFGAKLAPRVFIYSSVRIWSPRNLIMKDCATLGRHANCYNMGQVTLGKHAIVSQSVHICGGTHDVDDIHFQLNVRPIMISDFAWVAAEAFVGPGVTIGEGAVLGARGVTFRDIPAWKIFTGNPAVFLRDRNCQPELRGQGAE